MRHGLVDDAAGAFRGGDVGLNGENVARLRGPQRGRSLRQRVPSPAANGDFGAFVEQCARRGQSQPFAGTADQGDLVFHAHAECSFLRRS